MDTLIYFYLLGVVITFVINCTMFIENKNGLRNYEMDLSDRTITVMFSLIGAFLSWFFLIMLLLSRRNSRIANRLKQYFDNYKMHD